MGRVWQTANPREVDKLTGLLVVGLGKKHTIHTKKKEVMCQEAAELAYKGEKEDALMMYQRALHMKPNAPEIKNTIRAITSSISDNITASKTRKLFTTMKTLAHKKKQRISEISGTDLIQGIEEMEQQQSDRFLTRHPILEVKPTSSTRRLPPIRPVISEETPVGESTSKLCKKLTANSQAVDHDKTRVKLTLDRGSSPEEQREVTWHKDSTRKERHTRGYHTPEPTNKDNPPEGGMISLTINNNLKLSSASSLSIMHSSKRRTSKRRGNVQPDIIAPSILFNSLNSNYDEGINCVRVGQRMKAIRASVMEWRMPSSSQPSDNCENLLPGLARTMHFPPVVRGLKNDVTADTTEVTGVLEQSFDLKQDVQSSTPERNPAACSIQKALHENSVQEDAKITKPDGVQSRSAELVDKEEITAIYLNSNEVDANYDKIAVEDDVMIVKNEVKEASLLVVVNTNSADQQNQMKDIPTNDVLNDDPLVVKSQMEDTSSKSLANNNSVEQQTQSTYSSVPSVTDPYASSISSSQTATTSTTQSTVNSDRPNKIKAQHTAPKQGVDLQPTVSTQSPTAETLSLYRSQRFSQLESTVCARSKALPGIKSTSAAGQRTNPSPFWDNSPIGLRRRSITLMIGKSARVSTLQKTCSLNSSNMVDLVVQHQFPLTFSRSSTTLSKPALSPLPPIQMAQDQTVVPTAESPVMDITAEKQSEMTEGDSVETSAVTRENTTLIINPPDESEVLQEVSQTVDEDKQQDPIVETAKKLKGQPEVKIGDSPEPFEKSPPLTPRTQQYILKTATVEARMANTTLIENEKEAQPAQMIEMAEELTMKENMPNEHVETINEKESLIYVQHPTKSQELPDKTEGVPGNDSVMQYNDETKNIKDKTKIKEGNRIVHTSSSRSKTPIKATPKGKPKAPALIRSNSSHPSSKAKHVTTTGTTRNRQNPQTPSKEIVFIKPKKAITKETDPVRKVVIKEKMGKKKDVKQVDNKSAKAIVVKKDGKVTHGKKIKEAKSKTVKVQLQKKLEEEKGMALEDMSTEEQTTFKKTCARAVILAKSNLAFSANASEQPRSDSRTTNWTQDTPEFLVESTLRIEKNKGRPMSEVSTRAYAIAELRRIQADMDNCWYTKAQYRSTVVLEVMKEVECSEAYSEQEKQNVIANLHSLEGNACLELGLMDKALDAHNKDLAIGQDHGLLECRSRGMINIGRVHARAGRFMDAIDVWNDRLPLCVSAAERAWVLHEMGRCYYQMNKFADAQEFADKSCVNAQDASDSRMQFQATFLLAQCYDKLQAMEEALIEYKKALDMALVCDNEHDIPKIEDAIQRLNAAITDKIITTRNMEKMSGDAQRRSAGSGHRETQNEMPLTTRGIGFDGKSSPTTELYYMTLLYVMATLPEY